MAIETGNGVRVRGGSLIDRRSAVQGALSLGVAAVIGPAAVLGQTPQAPIVETSHGKVRGATENGVRAFRGIPYAASTAGANRFLPPQPVAAWAGVRDALKFGNSAPQLRDDDRPAQGNDPALAEDCLYLNVFAPAAAGSSRRPVMVWMHGGAWMSGSGSSRLTEGPNLARFGEVVVVTINHRLNLFGHLQLEDQDERFADSGNAGVLDMVAALRWVRDNIAAFGGDPANVTIFGVSGGGSKVSSLMATPAAQGLFHRVIAQSCSGSLRITERAEAARLTRELADKLGLGRATGAALQAVPMEQLVKFSGSVVYRPVLDGRTFTRHPFDPDAPPLSVHIPFMAGNLATESTAHLMVDRRNFSLDAQQVHKRVARFLRVPDPQAARIIAAYQAEYRGASPSDLLIRIATDYNYIRNTRREVELQAAAGRAPAYAYVFAWESPVNDGLSRSPHGMDQPFVFGTTAIAANRVGTGPHLVKLERMIMSTWTAFARTGNPDNATIPHWPAYDARSRATMVFNLESRVESDPGRKARLALDDVPYFEYGMPVNFPSPA